MTGREFVNACKADLCKTQSRSANGKLYSNKYLKELGKRAYKGINKNGVFTKRYSYGVAGHCCAGVQAHFIWAGYECFVPRFTSGKYVYIWNTNVYRKWLMTEPTIYKDGKKIGKVDYTTNYKNAKVGAVAFKGDGKNKKTATHTCVVDKIEGNYVYTVDFNVSDGHGHNNGTRHKRHKKYFVGFANMPYITTPKPTARYKVGAVYTLLEDMTVRKGAGTNQAIVKPSEMTADAQKHLNDKGELKAGTRVTCKGVKTDSKGAEWVLTPSGYICGRGSAGHVFIN